MSTATLLKKEFKTIQEREITREEAIESVRKLIRYIGDDPNREGLLETPERVIKSFDEIYQGYKLDSKEVLEKRFTSESDEMVILTNIELYSTCEHHMLPFTGKCHIAYLPNGEVLGISKLARIMEVYARRLQIQEELCWQIATAINEELNSHGVAVVIDAQHMCMTCRGIGKQNSIMRSSAMIGDFKTNQSTRSEFLNLIK